MYNLEEIKKLIYNIRGKEVMLDSDLARLYHCKNGTKDINKSVKRNLDRFPSDFYFQLTNEEYNFLKFQSGTSNILGRGGVRKLPYVFTEQGVAMLATILRTEIASQMSVNIMRAFVAMRHYIGNNDFRLSNVETKLIEHDLEIKLLEETFDKFEEKKKINEIYFNGQIYDAYSKIQDIFKSATKSLIIVDSYADNTLLDIIKRLNVEVIVITKKDNLLTNQDINKYNKQYHNLKIIENNDFHDRFIIEDNSKIYHLGSSINHLGTKTVAINIIEEDVVKKALINKINTIYFDRKV